MTHIITIETSNTSHLEKIKKLAQQLGVVTTERHEEGHPMSHAARKFLELQEKYPPKKISKGVDLNIIIDDSNL